MRELVLDNGLEFHSESLEQVCYSPGIEMHYSARREPWFKGKIERFFGSLNTLLKDNGEDMKVVQEAFRHASFRTTMNIYAQAIPARRREAQSKVFHQIYADSSS
ncbi:MAG: hypothetical protein P4L10_13130 [Acidobacteriaceae bacterium]|nr:hypothetical protein [Acidobacteriaceae bacterium]